MTTVAFKDGVMACDSQMSGNFISLTKRKVIKGNKSIVGFCGDAISGYSGALYLCGDEQDRPITTRDDDVLFMIWDGSRLFLADNEFRSIPVDDKFHAIGSGGAIAMAAMELGCSAPEAVKMAIKYDEYSGGRVLQYTFE